MAEKFYRKAITALYILVHFKGKDILMDTKPRYSHFPDAQVDAESSQRCGLTPQTCSPSYRLSYTDDDFMMRNELRPVRLQLELMKPELIQQEHGIEATVVIFGGSRVSSPETALQQMQEAEEKAKKNPDDPYYHSEVRRIKRLAAKAKYYEEARNLGRLVSEIRHCSTGCSLVVMTGGGPGIMEAANRGAHEAGAKNIGLNIVLPHEQAPNKYITPDLCFQFHYFSIRKMQFLMRAQALVVFPGGFGTLDELFETLTLIQTKKIHPLPILLFGREFWEKLIDFDFLKEEGVIAPEDLKLFQYVETAEEAVRIISDHFHANRCSIEKSSL